MRRDSVLDRWRSLFGRYSREDRKPKAKWASKRTGGKPAVKVVDDGWRIPDALWPEIAMIVQREDDRACMDAILFMIRTGCPWKRLEEHGFPPSTTVKGWYDKWAKSGVLDRVIKIAMPQS